MPKILLLILTIGSFQVYGQADTSNSQYRYAPPPGSSQWEDPTQREGGLTDQEKILSESFIHTGSNAKKIQEECAKNPKACEGKSNSGSSDAIIQTVAKAYSMFMGFAGKDFKSNKPDATKDEDKKVNDYCKYVPMATEMLAQTYQSVQQQTIATTAQAPQQEAQKAELYRVVRTHEARVKSAEIQRNGWGATALCYYATVATQPVSSSDPQIYIRTSAATLLTWYFGKKVGDEQEYANTVRSIADELRGPGDCNPITERDCYCSEETTKNDPQNCLPQMYRAWVQKTKATTPVGCINSQLQSDPSCGCLSGNNCFDVKLGSIMIGPQGETFSTNGGAQIMSSMMRGDLGRGGLNNIVQGINARGRIKIKDSDIPKLDRQLSKDEMNAVNQLAQESGLPPALVASLVSKPMDANANNFANKIKNDQLSLGKGITKYASYLPASKRSQILFMDEGGKFNRNKGSTKQNKFDFSSLNPNNKKKESRQTSTRILQLQEMAQKRVNQISEDSDRPIFQIISKRYQMSGWRELEIGK